MQVPFRADRRKLSTEVRDALRDLITAERLGIGDPLPSEAELCRRFAVGRTTVREAMKLLERDLLVESRHGVGHFVAGDPTRINRSITELQSVTELMTELGLPCQTTVMSQSIAPAIPEHAKRLGVDADTLLVALERLHASRGEPMIYTRDWFPLALVGTTTFTGSLLELFERKGVLVTSCEAAVRASPLPAEVADRVGVDRCLSWLVMEQVSYDGRRPVLLSHDFYRGDRFEFHTLRRRTRRPRLPIEVHVTWPTQPRAQPRRKGG